MDRFEKLRKAIRVQFADNELHIDFAFEQGYKDMQEHVLEEYERDDEVLSYSFNWSRMLQLPTEGEQTAYYFGARCASRVEYLLLLLDEEAVSNQMEDIILQEHHNMLYTPKIEAISMIVEIDSTRKSKIRSYSPRKVHPWLDQTHHPAVMEYNRLARLLAL